MGSRGESVRTGAPAEQTVEAARARSFRAPDPGDRVGRYTIIELIGAGGMGVVCRARDPELDRDVALKLLRARGGAADARLLREARAMAALSHENVLPVYDIGQAEGALFIAMELVDGCDLSQWHSRPRPWRDVVAAVAFVLGNLGALAAEEEQLGRALELWTEARAILELRYGPDHENVALMHRNLGQVQALLGQTEEALASLRHAREIEVRVLGPEHPAITELDRMIADLQPDELRPRG